jgi:hypothetical protein
VDATLAVSLLVIALGSKLAYRAFCLIKSRDVRAIEDKVTFFEKSASFTKSDSRRFYFACGLGSYFMAWLQYVSPGVPSFTGRWGWLNSLVYQNLGSNGMVLLWVIVATVCLSGAAQAPKA